MPISLGKNESQADVMKLTSRFQNNPDYFFKNTAHSLQIQTLL